jgi:hypothetical protein
MSRSKVGIWSPELEMGFHKKNIMRVCLGHYANLGFNNPGKEKDNGAHHAPIERGCRSNPSLLFPLCTGRFVLEIVDKRSSRFGGKEAQNQLRALIDKVLPMPVRYRQVC